MRLLFWGGAAAFLLLGLVGIGAPPPLLEGVAGETLADWYRGQAMWGTVLGAVAGVVSALLAPRHIRHRTGEESASFLARVRGWGVGTLMLSLLLLAAFCFVIAYGYAAVPLSATQRGLTLLFAAKALLVLGFGVAAAALAFALVTRVVRWGGSYALVGPNLLRPTRRS